MTRPNINVTPLIDVLLVLLIIFMVAAPHKPTDIKAKVPAELKDDSIIDPNPKTLVVSIDANSNLSLNNVKDLGTIAEPSKLVEKLRAVFAERTENRVYDEALLMRDDVSESERILKTVFIKAPVAMDYGNVVKVIDAVKTSGANPVGLQIDNLTEK